MKKFTFILLLAFFFGMISKGFSQDCPSASLHFYDQNDIDAFAANYPNCTQIEGILRIGGPPTSVIHNLNGLSNLQHIGAHVFIENNKHLKNLEGLNNLETIGYHLIIKGCDSLESLQGLSSLTSVGAHYDGDLVIEGNKKLIDLNGLENLNALTKDLIIAKNVDLLSVHGLEGLTNLSGNVIITENTALQTLEGLENLTNLSGNVIIMENKALQTLEGLDNLMYVAGDFVVEGNLELLSTGGPDQLSHIGGDLIIRNQPLMPSLSGETGRDSSPAFNSLLAVDGEIRISNNVQLQHLNGLQNLMETGSFIRIFSNRSLQQLNGFQNLNATEALRIEHNVDLHTLQEFENLTTIRDYLLITGNHSLTSLEGFEGLLPETVQSIYVAGNHSLSDCAVESLCNYLIELEGEAHFANNAGGCNSNTDVIEACYTALPDEMIVHELGLYPNPAGESIYIIGLPDGMKLHNLQIWNHTGQLVRELAYPPLEIGTHGLSPGMYLFSLELDNKTVQRKVVIK